MGEDHWYVRRRHLRGANGLVLEGNDHIDTLADERSRGLLGGALVGLIAIVQMDGAALFVAQTLEARA